MIPNFFSFYLKETETPIFLFSLFYDFFTSKCLLQHTPHIVSFVYSSYLFCPIPSSRCITPVP